MSPVLASWQETVTAVASGIGALGLIAAAVAVVFTRQQIIQAKVQIENAKQQLIEAQRSRNAQLLADISRRWDEDVMIASRRVSSALRTPKGVYKTVKRLRKKRKLAYFQMMREPNFLEDIAIMEAQGAIDFASLHESLGGVIVKSWERWELAVEYLRYKQGTRVVYENFERLAQRMADADAAAESAAATVRGSETAPVRGQSDVPSQSVPSTGNPIQQG